MEQPVLDPATVKRNRMILLVIMTLPLLVIGGATGLWWAVKSGKLDIVGSLGTHNEGILLSPVREISSVELFDEAGQPFKYGEQATKWSLLIPGTASCDESCRDSLWLTRQLHTAMGHRAAYMRRYYLSDSWPLDEEFASYLGQEHPELEVLHTSPDSLEQLLGAQTDGRRPLQDNLYFLIDKRGFVMMAYGPEHSGNQLKDDLKFLMKQSGDD